MHSRGLVDVHFVAPAKINFRPPPLPRSITVLQLFLLIFRTCRNRALAKLCARPERERFKYVHIAALLGVCTGTRPCRICTRRNWPALSYPHPTSTSVNCVNCPSVRHEHCAHPTASRARAHACTYSNIIHRPRLVVLNLKERTRASELVTSALNPSARAARVRRRRRTLEIRFRIRYVSSSRAAQLMSSGVNNAT